MSESDSDSEDVQNQADGGVCGGVLGWCPKKNQASGLHNWKQHSQGSISGKVYRMCGPVCRDVCIAFHTDPANLRARGREAEVTGRVKHLDMQTGRILDATLNWRLDGLAGSVSRLSKGQQLGRLDDLIRGWRERDSLRGSPNVRDHMSIPVHNRAGDADFMERRISGHDPGQLRYGLVFGEPGRLRTETPNSAASRKVIRTKVYETPNSSHPLIVTTLTQ